MRTRLLALVLLLTPACVNVRPWEREVLAKHGMDAAAPCRALADAFRVHTFDVREGASGGHGQVGGGCGCN